MLEADVFVLADRALNDVIQQIKDDQWTMTVPANFPMRQTDQLPTLRAVVNYHAYDDAWVPDMLAGRTMDQAGRSKFDGDLLGSEPQASFAAIVDTACIAAAELDDLDRIVHCSFGDFSAREYFWQINGFRGLRAHDLALVIGIEPDLPDELIQGIWDEISPHIEEWRAIGVFPAAVTGRPPTSV
jgi:hypothetical protein